MLSKTNIQKSFNIRTKDINFSTSEKRIISNGKNGKFSGMERGLPPRLVLLDLASF